MKKGRDQGLTDPRDAGVVVLIISVLFDGSWQTTVDCHRLEQVAAPTGAAVLNVTSSLEQITQLLVPDVQVLMWRMHSFQYPSGKQI